jgi:hypothetical protein
VAVVLRVAVYLTVCALQDIPFVFGLLKFNFTLLEIFHVVYVLIVWGGLEFDEEHGKRKFGSTLFDAPNI